MAELPISHDRTRIQAAVLPFLVAVQPFNDSIQLPLAERLHRDAEDELTPLGTAYLGHLRELAEKTLRELDKLQSTPYRLEERGWGKGFRLADEVLAGQLDHLRDLVVMSLGTIVAMQSDHLSVHLTSSEALFMIAGQLEAALQPIGAVAQLSERGD